ncbi:MAG: hypothetical protein FWD17_07440 [Polyangiaceae bacterium]|nr:hypothetical protein [Polyangiaceae bacterium]
MAFERGRVARFAGVLAAVVSLAGAPGSARADSTSSQRQLARDLMKRGNELRAANDLEGALDAFRSADGIMHAPTTGFEVARSEAQLGKLVEAADMIARVLTIPSPPDEPQAFKDAREYARLLERDVAPRVPKILLRVDTRGGLTVSVSVDGESIPVPAFDIPYAVDPGEHSIEAGWADGRSAKVDVVVREGEQREVELGLPPEPEVPVVPIPPAPLPQPLPVTPANEPSPAPHPLTLDRRMFAWVAFGAAGAAAIAGSGTGIASWVRTSSVSSRCHGNLCPPSTYGDINTARALATASTVSFIVAGVAAAAGGVILLGPWGAPAKRPAAASVGIAPWVGLGSAGIAGAFF